MLKELPPRARELRQALPGYARVAREKLVRHRYLAWHLAALAAAFFATRLLFLTRLPIFCDEAIYLYWAQLVADGRQHRLISYTDGKPPLHSWLLGWSTLRFDDPLVAGRAVSVLAGALGLAGVIAAAWVLLRSRRAGLAAGWLYVLAPFCLFHDRLGVPDALVAALGAWALLLAVLLARGKTLGAALLLGWVVGLGMLTKQPARIFLMLAPVALLASTDRSPRALARWAGLLALAYLEVRALDAIRYLSPKAGLLLMKEYQYAIGPSEWRTALFIHLPRNLGPTLDAFLRLLTPVPLLLAGLGVVWCRRHRPLAVAAAWSVLPILAVAGASRLIPFPRYLLIGVPCLLVVAAGAGDLLWERLPRARRHWLLAGCLVPMLLFDAAIILRPDIAPLPATDRYQYVEGWPAGYGVREVVAKIEEDSRQGTVDVVTHGGLGLTPMAFPIYFPKRHDVRFFAIEEYRPEVAAPIGKDGRAQVPYRRYLIQDSTHVLPSGWQVREVARYARPGGHTALVLREIE